MAFTNILIGLVVLVVTSNFGSIAARPPPRPPVSVEEQGFGSIAAPPPTEKPPVSVEEQGFGSIAAPPPTEKPPVSVEEQGFDVTPFAEGQSIVRLTLVPGQSDYAACAGTYRKLPAALIRKKPVYYKNYGHTRIIFYTGRQWAITAAHYVFVIMNGATGAFYYSRVSYGFEASAASWLPRYRCD